MRGKIKPSKSFIVAILLAAYSSVYVTEFLCSFEDGFAQLSQQRAHKVGQHSHDDISTPDETPYHNDNHSDDDNSDDDNCCKDLTYSFISDLLKLTTPTFELKIRTFNDPFFIHTISIPKYDYLTAQLTPYHYKLPPPRISDIRVFIQSFII